MNKLLAGLFCASLFSGSAFAKEVVFSEDFSGDFSQWVGKTIELDGQLQHEKIFSMIVADPEREGKKAAQSTQKVFGGDFITQQSFPPGKYILSFDYMGTCKRDCGGVIGYGEGFPGIKHSWVAGTTRAFPTGLRDNKGWNRYNIPITVSYDFHLIFEQWTDSQGEAGTVFFADIQLEKQD